MTKGLMYALAVLCLFGVLLPWTAGQFCNGPKRGYINDTTGIGHDDVITVGFFFPFHGPGLRDGVCSADIPNLDNIQLLEMARYRFLFSDIPGVRIALEAFDSCYSDQVAVEQSVRYLNERISVTGGGQSCLDGSFKPGIILHGAERIGPSVGAFLTDAQVPIISYAATQSQLTSNEEYSYFSRVITSDKDEAMVIVDILRRLGWTYVSVIYSEGQDDTSAMESFKKAAGRSNICISQMASFPVGAIEATVASTMVNLLVAGSNNQATPNVVIIFTHPLQASWIVSQANRQPAIGDRIQWVVGQHVMSDTTPLDDLPVSDSRGVIGVVSRELSRDPMNSFEEWFKMQTPNTVSPSQNPWFNEFWQAAYQCNLPGSDQYATQCGSTHEDIHWNNFKFNPYTNLISNAISNFVTGLNSAQEAMCGSSSSGLCDAFRNMQSTELLNYIRDAGYKANGDPAQVMFDIQNYKSGIKTTVGSWEEGSVGLNLDPADLELWSDVGMVPVTSVCGKDCTDEKCFQSLNVTRVYRNGDIILGGMFSVHKPSEGKCGDINEQGIQRLEAMLFAMDKINQDSTLLPGITLGVEGLDTCGTPDIAGHLALQLSASADFGNSGSGERFRPDGLPEHIYAIIGPETNEETEIVIQITSVYELPIVGYAADSPILSNLYQYPNFARVITPSQTQASAMIEVIYRQGWKYMHVLYSATRYGLYGANTVESIGTSRDVCTTNKLQIPADATMVDWDKIFSKLEQRFDARVLVLFMEDYDIVNLFTQLMLRNRVGHYFIVVNDKLMFRNSDLVTRFPDLMRGVIVVTTPLRDFTEYRNHFANLRPTTNVRNPWFSEFWEDKFQCSLDGAEGIPCNGNNRVDSGDLTDKYLAEVIDSVYTVAHALDQLQREQCPGHSGVCAEMTKVSGPDLWDLIRHTRFNSANQDNNLVSFNNLADGTPVHEVYNYQSDVNGGRFEFIQIGHFESYIYTDNYNNNRLKVYDEKGEEIASPQSTCSGQCHHCQRPNDKGDTAEIKNGDVWLGGFFRLHTIGPDKLTCTDELILYNMQLLEAFLFAIDSINDDPSLLPNIKLGAIGFDTCGSASRAKREVANFVTAAVEYRNGYFSNRLTVSGIIGEETSETTLALAETVTPLQVSQISYAATTSKLDDREKYPYFMRTVASNQKQAEALVALLDRFDWRYVSVVYSDDEFGKDMYDNVKKQIEDKNICIALSLKILSTFGASDLNTIVKELQFNPQAKVVLLLTSDLHAKALLKEAESLGVNDIQWVGGDTWGARTDVIDQAPLTSSGSIILQFRSEPVNGFREYFTSRPTYTNLRNPWWRRYLSDYFQCNFQTPDVPLKYDHLCPANLDLDSGFKEAAEVQYLVRGVYIFAVGLQFAMNELCPNVTSYVCQEVLENPEALQRNIQGAGFQHADGSVYQFDEIGNGPANYDILNVQRNQGNNVAYTKVGSWDSGVLDLNLDNVKSYRGQSQISPITTQCRGRCNECRQESDTSVEFIQIPGQIQIPGLFAVHEYGDHLVECGEVREAGIVNLEAFLFALDRINNDAGLLPKVTVGTTAFDTCMSGSRGVRELSGLLSGTATFSKEQKLPGTFSTIVGVVGAESDAVTMATGALTGQYKYAQVAYGASSDNSRNDQYLIQAGPSLTEQAEAVVALVKAYGWQYVSVVYGDDDIYYQAASEFLRAAKSADICVATNAVLGTNANRQVVFDLINEGAGVVIAFAAASDIKKLLSIVGGTNGNSHLTWVLAFPDSIDPSDLIPRSSNAEILRGALVLSTTEEIPSAFQQHLEQLTLQTDTYNPWFAETDGSIMPEIISEFGPNAAYIIDATYAIAYGIHSLLERLCPDGTMCSDFVAADPEEFYDEIAKASFTNINQKNVQLMDGSLVQQYRISNYQKTENSFSLVEVGSWASGDELPTLSNSVRLFDGAQDVDNIQSNCPSADACTMCVLPPTGLPEQPRPRPTDPSGGGEFTKGLPNRGKLAGTPSSDLDSLWFIILVVFSAIGIIVSAIIICLLLWRWDEPITRTISPFLCLVILIGVILLYAVTPLFAVPISTSICALQRVFPGVAWCVCFSGVFLQVMRHWRIGRRERRISGAKVSFVNNSSQVVLFLFLLGFQVILAVEWLILQPPSIVVASNVPTTPSEAIPPSADPSEATLDCAYSKESMITYCIFVFTLLALSFLVSILARRYGHVISVMELNTLLVCNFVNILIMAAWVVVELLIEADVHRPATSAAATATATVTLIILFAYRVKVLFRNHDPFVDTASVASGEYFSGTMSRVPATRMSINTDLHIYDQTPGDTTNGGAAYNNGAYNGSASNGSRSSLEKPPLGKETTGF